jgi:hypothetical protein
MTFRRSVASSAISPRQSIRKSVAIPLRPFTVGWHRLHGRPTFGAADARTFHLGFSHAEAGLSFQAGADINNVTIAL